MASSSIRRCRAATPAPEGFTPPRRGRTYAPDANYNGTDSFSYRLSDGALNSNITTVSLAVSSVSDAPSGADHAVTMLEDTAYVFKATDFGFSDAQDAASNAIPLIYG